MPAVTSSIKEGKLPYHVVAVLLEMSKMQLKFIWNYLTKDHICLLNKQTRSISSSTVAYQVRKQNVNTWKVKTLEVWVLIEAL
jgi:hypothetical protein